MTPAKESQLSSVLQLMSNLPVPFLPVYSLLKLKDAEVILQKKLVFGYVEQKLI